MRILVIEDDVKVAAHIKNGFLRAEFLVDGAEDGEKGLEAALSGVHDAIVLDLNLPKKDGLSLLEEIRGQGIITPVIILSANRSIEERIRGLNRGSDDYLVKPFSFSELLARVQAQIRRSCAIPDVKIEVADLVMDLLTRKVVRGDATIELKPREFKLLQYLIHNKDRVISKSMILEHIWGYTFDPQTNVVDVLVCRLRNKVDKDFQVKLIHTIRGIGYVLKEN